LYPGFPIPPLSNEPANAYEAFKLFCQLPSNKRSLPSLLDHPAISVGHRRLKEYSRQYHWFRRAKQYDEWHRLQQLEAARDELVKLKRKEAEIKLAELEQYRKALKAHAAISHCVGQRLLEVLNAHPKTQTNEGMPNVGELRSLATTYQAIQAGIKPAFENWSQAIGMEELLEQLREIDELD
jgi:hypothetical protein